MIIKLSEGRYKVRIKTNGKAVDRTFYSLKEAKDYEGAERGKRAERLTSSGPAPRFSDFLINSYRAEAKRHLQESTWGTRKYTLAILEEFFGPLPLDRINLDRIEEFQDARRKAGIGNVKINDDTRKLLTILRYAKSKKVRLEIPEVRYLPEEIVEDRVLVWTDDQVQALYAALEEECPHLLPITVCMVNTGMRKSEALAMEWSWVDFKKRMISIPPITKNRRAREVTISDALMAVLKKQRQRFNPTVVFPTLPDMKHPQGTAYTEWPQNQWDRARKASKVGGSPHVCRHTFASHFLQATPDLWLLSKVLGHSDPKVTAKIYAHLLPSHLAKSLNAVNIAPKGGR